MWNEERILAREKFPWLSADGRAYPINPAFGLQKDLPNFLLSQHKITNAKLAHRYVERLHAMAGVLDAASAGRGASGTGRHRAAGFRCR